MNNLFFQPELVNGVTFLDEEESRHCVKVLRMRKGDTICIVDGRGTFYNAIITDDDPRQCEFHIQSTESEPTKNFRIHVAISPTKNADRIEWFVEKCVEIGIDEISLMLCKHTERSFIKVDRLRKVAMSAMKQSLKASLARINDLTSFDEILGSSSASRFICHVDSSNPLHLQTAAAGFNDAVILIGPEGDFSQEELINAKGAGFNKVSLGPNRLRTETAGVAACHILNLLHQK